MIRPIIQNEKFNYDIVLVVKTRQLTFRECQHRALSNIEAVLEDQRLEKSTYYYCPICKDYRTIKDIT